MTAARAERARRRAARAAKRAGKAAATAPQPQPTPPSRPRKRWPRITPIEEWGARTIFKFSVAYLILLLVLPLAYGSNLWGFRDHVGDPIAGLIPIGVPLAGALGAVTIGLYGVFEHNKRWDTSYNYWHLTRPLMGALLGSVGFLIFVATIQSTGVEPVVTTSTTTTSTTTTSPSNVSPTLIAPVATAPDGRTDASENPKPRDLIIYYVIGFIVGYREETFRELVKRAADILFKPGGSGQARIALIVDKPVGACPHTVVLTPAVAASVVEWKLDFGDGEGTNGQGTPAAAAHTYNTPGIFLATLEVTETTGGKSAAATQITVTGSPVAPASTAALADTGVQRIERATTDAEKSKIERELITNTDKFLEPPFTNPTPTDADNA